MKLKFRPTLGQRIYWAVGMAVACWRATGTACEIASDDDHPDDVAARIRAAEERQGKPRRVVPN